MKDQSKTKQALIQELASLRQTVAELEQSESERKWAVKDLPESEIYRVLFNESTLGILAADIETQRFVWANPTICRMVGYSETEMLQWGIADLHHKESLDMVISIFKSQIRGEKPLASVLPCLRKDGTVFYADVSGFNTIIKGRSCSVGFFTDTTERKLSEDALRKEKHFAENLIQTAQVIVLILDTTGHIVSINPYMEEISGYRLEEVRGKDWFSTFVQERDQNSTKELFLRAIDNIQTRGNITPIVTKDSHERIIEWHDKTLKDEKGDTVGLLSIGQDATERKKAEASLKETLENLRKSFSVTIQVMVSSIEARDPYTAGHQIRAADLARAIATEMRLSPDRIEGIRMAGSIHDIGKLSIPAEILSKPSKLSDIEFSLIKEHSRKGYEMLKDVESPWPLAEIVYQHHERMNGSGYPRNLKGDEIIVEARILGVADVVEAMASHRPYRPGLGIDAALKEIENNKGTIYDAHAADACLRLFREKGFTLEET